MNTLRVQRNATQRQPLLCLSLSNSIKIFEKSKPAYEIFSWVGLFFLFVKLIKTVTVCLTRTVILSSEIKQLSEELCLYKANPEKPVIE